MAGSAQMVSPNDEELLVKYLSRLMSEGAAGEFLIVSVDEYYVQFQKQPRAWEASLYCEIVSNESIPELVSEIQASQFRHLGFESPTLGFGETGVGSPNFSRDYYAADRESLFDIARTTFAVLCGILGLEASRTKFQLSLDQHDEGDGEQIILWPNELTDTIELLKTSGSFPEVLFAKEFAISLDRCLAVCSTYACLGNIEWSFAICLLDLNRKNLLTKFRPVVAPGKMWPRKIVIEAETNIVRLIYDDNLDHRYSFDGRFLDSDRWETDRLYVARNWRYGYDLVEIAMERLSDLDSPVITDYCEVISLFNESLEKGVSDNTQARVHRTLGEIYLRCQEKETALQHLQSALSLNPNVGVKRLVGRLRN